MAAPDFLKKLGAKPGQVVRIPDADLRPFRAGAVVLPEPPKSEKVHRVVFRPRRREELARLLREYWAIIFEDCFVWAVIPKRTAIESLGVDVTFEGLLDVAMCTDFVDNNKLTFSEMDHGVGFVV